MKITAKGMFKRLGYQKERILNERFISYCIGYRRIIEWLKKPYQKQTYKLTQFEYDLLQHFSVDFKFKEMGLLKEMKEKGHFKNINGDELIKDILESCEVIK